LYIIMPPKPKCSSSPLCWWHVYIYNRSQRGLCSQKAAARPHFYGVVEWALEHKINEDKAQAIYSPYHWKFSKAHIGPWCACGFQISVYLWFIIKWCRQQAEVIQNHENENVGNTGTRRSPTRKV
jgi:hypothetical protein